MKSLDQRIEDHNIHMKHYVVSLNHLCPTENSMYLDLDLGLIRTVNRKNKIEEEVFLSRFWIKHPNHTSSLH